MSASDTIEAHLTPDLGARVAAGVFDAAFLAALTTALTLAPLLAGGLALPMIGVFAATIAYIIVPMAAFKATLGMWIFGIEIVGTDGRPADATDLLFRELIGRGLLGAAYFATVIFGFAGYLAGAMTLFQPSGFGLVLFVISAFLLLFGTVSHLTVLGTDGRGLHDRIAKTMLIKRQPKQDAALESEADELLGRSGSSRVRNIVLFEIALLSATVMVPYMLSRPTPGIEDLEARTKLKTARYAFKKSPADRNAYSTYSFWLSRTGNAEELAEVRTRHREARAEQERAREEAVRKSLADRPGDWATMVSLLDILDKRGAKDEARAVFLEYLEHDSSASTLATYGVWLYDHGFAAEAVERLNAAIAAGADDASVNAYLGWAYEELGDDERALEALQKSLEMDPTLDRRIFDDVERLTQAG